MSHRQATVLVFVVSLLCLGATGCGQQSFTQDVGTLTVAAVAPNPVSALTPTLVTLTGGDFTNAIGNQADVTFLATGATPFLGGTSARQSVIGLVTSATTIDVTTPMIVICGPPTIDVDVMVTLESGVFGVSTVPLTFEAPTITGIDNDATPGTVFQATTPEPFTVTGTGFGPVGGPAFVAFTSTSAAPADLPFNGSALAVVTGTITSATTITGTSPEATLVPGPLATPGACVNQDALADVGVTFPGGACTPTPLSGATFAGPTTSGLAVAGFAAPAVPSTVLLGKALPETFTVSGTGFGPLGSSALVSFEDLLLGGAFDGGLSVATVPGTVLSPTTITGTLPAVTATRLTANVSTRVRVTCQNGSGAYCNDGANFIAPPTITDVATALLVREGGTRAFLTRCSTRLTISGSNFGPFIPVRILVDGTETDVGPGFLGNPTFAATSIFGDSPVDPSINTPTQVRAHVTNHDGQFHEFTAPDFEYLPLGHHESIDATPNAGTNSEMECAIDPTDPTNLAILCHNLGTPGSSMRVAYTTDGGATWLQTAVDNTIDGLGGLGRNDPRIAYDRFGTLYINYFTTGGPRQMIVAQSFDKGANFTNAVTVAVDAGAGMDKQFMVIGPNGANPAQDAIYVGWTDNAGTFGTPTSIVVSGAVTTGAALGAGAFSAPLLVSGGLGGNFDWSNGAVGPNGDLHVVFHDNTGNPTGPLTVLYGRDPGGMFTGASFGPNIVVDTSNVGSFEPIAASPNRTIFPNSDVNVIQTGVLALRVVVCFGDEIPDGSDDVDTIVRFTDNNGATWSPRVRVNNDITTTSQFFASCRADPVTGALGAAWYDCRADLVNNRQVQVFGSMSFDGGATWEPNMRISDGTSDQALMADPREYLDYLGFKVFDGCCFVSWSDNSNSDTANPNPNGTQLTDAYVARFQFK